MRDEYTDNYNTVLLRKAAIACKAGLETLYEPLNSVLNTGGGKNIWFSGSRMAPSRFTFPAVLLALDALFSMSSLHVDGRVWLCVPPVVEIL